MGLREKAERILRGKFSAEKYPEIEPEIIYDDDSVSLPNKSISSESLEIEDEFGGDLKFSDIDTEFSENDISNMIIDEIPEPFFSEDNIDISNNVSDNTANDDLFDLGIKDDQTDLSEDQTKTAETLNVSADDTKLSHNDNLLLIEIAKEIMKSSSINHLKETAIFSIMSYLSVEGVSVISPESDESDKWILSDSKGVKIKSKRITFNSSDSIFKDVFENGILFDLTEYANSSSEEYLKFKSIGSKILISITDKNKPVLLISVCSKIDGEPFSDAEKRFIRELSEFMSLAAGSCLESDRLKSQNLTLLDNSRKLIDIDTYEERIRKSAADSDIENYIRGEMANNGVSSFAFFERDDKDDVFKLKYSEEKDSLNFQKKSFSISLDNAFTAYLFSIKGYAVIENPINNEVLHRIFDEEMLARMNIFVSMPYVIRGRLTGFALILRADIDHLPSNLVQINRLSKVVFSFFQNSRSIEIFTSKYYDLLSSYLKKLSDEIKHADEMNIPLTFSGFCIKNMKRLVTVYGEKQADDILFSLSEAIAKRLSETDFAVRYSRNSIVAVFPGKQKKSVAVAANLIKNEVTERFRKYEVPVMINFLICEYPDEAKTLDEILSVVE
ncbi:MAG TPA: diguanylate cyclase [Spirochaetota bacterium]|nr:diguanylate cyclase [Spirochaetota bacterium]HQA51703.1 diguanylate cyclase [Spirochaetota bacterium]